MMNLKSLFTPTLLVATFVCNTTLHADARPNNSGTIQGTLIYPSDFIPAQKVCAVNIQTKKMLCVETKQDQKTYSLEVPTGTYNVFAVACQESYRTEKTCSDGYGTKRAYYNENIRCGLTYECSKKPGSQRPIPVKVNAGKVLQNVNPQDWYPH